MQSLYEVLGPFKSVEERKIRVQQLSSYNEELKLSIFEVKYIDFIKNSKNGLYNLIKKAIVNNLNGDDLCFYWNNHEPIQQYVEYFLNKYHYKYKIEHISYSSNMICILQNIKTVACVKDLLLCYYGELQQMEHFSKSKEELWHEYQDFVVNNAEWLRNKQNRAH